MVFLGVLYPIETLSFGVTFERFCGVSYELNFYILLLVIHKQMAKLKLLTGL